MEMNTEACSEMIRGKGSESSNGLMEEYLLVKMHMETWMDTGFTFMPMVLWSSGNIKTATLSENSSILTNMESDTFDIMTDIHITTRRRFA